MEMADMVRVIADTPDCRVHSPQGRPVMGGNLDLPADLLEFYELCGGVDLYGSSEFPLSMVGPLGFRPSNLAIVGESFPEDISSLWHIVAEASDGEYVSIDLAPERQGRCYDSFHDVHGIAGSSPIVARGFSELLGRLMDDAGGPRYWLHPDFVSLGDAYD